MTALLAPTAAAGGGRAGALLEVWERGVSLDPQRRALLLARDATAIFGSVASPPWEPAGPMAASGAVGPTDLELQPVGRVQALLLQLKLAAFGPTLEATASCPTCTGVVEFQLDAGRLAAADHPSAPAPVEVAGFRLDWRSPTPADLCAAAKVSAAGGDPEGELLRRCVRVVEHPAGTRTDTLPGPVRSAVAEAMAEADQLAEILVDVGCPLCGATFTADLDVGAFVWSEVERLARQLLLDVDLLARAYGWTEPQVLALSDTRRRAYLRIIAEGTP